MCTFLDLLIAALGEKRMYKYVYYSPLFCPSPLSHFIGRHTKHSSQNSQQRPSVSPTDQSKSLSGYYCLNLISVLIFPRRQLLELRRRSFSFQLWVFFNYYAWNKRVLSSVVNEASTAIMRRARGRNKQARRSFPFTQLQDVGRGSLGFLF